MKRRTYLAVTLLLATGCVGAPLDAGSNGAASTPSTAPATTVASFSTQIDALVMDDAFLYFTTDDGFLQKVAKTGGGTPVTLAQAAVPGSTHTEGVALDDDNIYWAAFGDGISTGAILSVSKAGGTPTTLAGSEARPTGLAVDDTNVYWSNQGPPNPMSATDLTQTESAIFSVPKSGGTPTALVSGMGVPDALTLDATGVIWHDTYGLRRVPKGGGAVVTLTQEAIAWNSSNLIVAGSTLYWGANQGEWSLQSMTTTGGAVTTLAASIDTPGSIASDGTSLLSIVASGENVGEVLATPLGAADDTEEALPDVVPTATDEQTSFLLADTNALYWVEYWEAPKLTVAIRTRAR